MGLEVEAEKVEERGDDGGGDRGVGGNVGSKGGGGLGGEGLRARKGAVDCKSDDAEVFLGKSKHLLPFEYS